MIDGVLNEGEWEGSTSDTMSDGALVHFMSSDGVLYVAVAGEEIGAVNVLLATEAEVVILHSSAALGSARYIPGDSLWDLDHGFDWCCRSTSDDSPRLELYEDEGWQANIGFVGDPGVVEYAIALPWSEAALVISSIRDEEDQGFWPADLSEETRDELLGTPPSERSYDVAEWPQLIPDS